MSGPTPARSLWRCLLGAWLLATGLLVAATVAAAAATDGLVPVPTLQARVTDLTGTLTPEQVATLEQTLRDFEARKGTQVAVLMVPTTQPEAIEQYSIRVVEQWRLGRRKVDDGALLLIAKQDRAIRIEVGYGLEGVLTDATTHRIIEETIGPRLHVDDYYGGISAGVDRIVQVAAGEALPSPPPGADAGRQAGRGHGLGNLLPLLVFVAIAVGSVLRAIFGRLLGALFTGGLIGIGGWVLGAAAGIAVLGGVLAFVVTLLGVGTGWGGGFYGGGGFGGGGGGGGGFGGGGGGFGGGGASGRY